MFVKSNGRLIVLPDPEPIEFSITEAEYPSYVSSRIHEKYSIDDEIAILRQKNEKPEEYAEYYAYCESVKEEAKLLIKNETV